MVGSPITQSAQASPAPGWELTARTFPTTLSPGGKGTIEVDVVNVGEASSEGLITVTDVLPSGVTAINAGGVVALRAEGSTLSSELWSCDGDGPGNGVSGASVVHCTNEATGFSFAGGGGPPGRGEEREANRQPELGIEVESAGGEATGTNHVTVEGGGAIRGASTSNPIAIADTPSGFGVSGWDGWLSNADGSPDTQAGSHPYEATFSFDLATRESEGEIIPAGGEVKDVVVDLPLDLWAIQVLWSNARENSWTAVSVRTRAKSGTR